MELIKVDERTRIDLESGRTCEAETYKIGRYEVDHYVVTYEDGDGYERICVSGEWKAEYLPDIQYEDGRWGEEKKCFKIQTTAYGALNPEEIKKVIAGYNEAMEVVAILTEKFCK